MIAILNLNASSSRETVRRRSIKAELSSTEQSQHGPTWADVTNTPQKHIILNAYMANVMHVIHYRRRCRL